MLRYGKGQQRRLRCGSSPAAVDATKSPQRVRLHRISMQGATFEWRDMAIDISNIARDTLYNQLVFIIIISRLAGQRGVKCT